MLTLEGKIRSLGRAFTICAGQAMIQEQAITDALQDGQ